jgi:hypothetical protein
VVVVLGLYAASIGGRAAATVSYLEVIRSAGDDLSVSTQVFLGVVGGLGRIDRAEFVTSLQAVREDLERAGGLAAAPPPTLTGASNLHRLALGAWLDGIGQFEQGVLTAADEPASLAAADLVTAALYRLQAGDQLYAALVEELARIDVPDPISPLPEIHFVQVRLPIATAGQTLAATAGSDASLIRLRPDLAVEQVSSVPEWVLNPAGQLVVEAVESIGFEVVVANRGNAPAGGPMVTLELTGEGNALSDESPAADLEAGQQTVVKFDNLTVRPGGLYRLVVSLVMTDPDRAADNNSRVVDFSINE